MCFCFLPFKQLPDAGAARGGAEGKDQPGLDHLGLGIWMLMGLPVVDRFFEGLYIPKYAKTKRIVVVWYMNHFIY